jgi:hypothetical protein
MLDLGQGTMRQVKIIVEKHADGYVAYPLGMKGVVVGEGLTSPRSWRRSSRTGNPDTPSRFKPSRMTPRKRHSPLAPKRIPFLANDFPF